MKKIRGPGQSTNAVDRDIYLACGSLISAILNDPPSTTRGDS